jgi:hypothetical protein
LALLVEWNRWSGKQQRRKLLDQLRMIHFISRRLGIICCRAPTAKPPDCECSNGGSLHFFLFFTHPSIFNAKKSIFEVLAAVVVSDSEYYMAACTCTFAEICRPLSFSEKEIKA